MSQGGSPKWQSSTGCHKLVEIIHCCYKVGELTVQGCHKLVTTKYKVITRLLTLLQPCHQVVYSKLGISTWVCMVGGVTPNHK